MNRINIKYSLTLIDGQPLSAEMMAFKLRDLAYLYGSTGINIKYTKAEHTSLMTTTDNISVVVIKFKIKGASISPSSSTTSTPLSAV